MKKVKPQLFISIILLFITTVLTASNNSPLVRYPALNNDASKLAVSYQGDIWVVPANGGTAQRLTIHEAYESQPVWSPDNNQIAFSSDRFGNNDIYVIPATGGLPKRLTYHSSSDYIYNWTDKKGLVFTTARTFKQAEWDSEIYSVSPDGGTPVRILDAVGDMPSVSPDGKLIAFVMGSCRVAREEYSGPANKNIWIYNTTNDTYSQITEFERNDIMPVWGDSQTLFFISSKPGKYNIFKIGINAEGKASGNAEQLTDYNDDGVRFISVSKDGRMIAFEKQTDIYTMDSNGENVSKIDIALGTDYRFDPYEHKTYSNNANGYAISPNGKYNVLVMRGEIFVSENDKDKSKTVNLSNHAYRESDAAWLNDSTVIFTSDRNGQYDLYLGRSSDTGQPEILKSLKHEVVRLTNTDDDESSPLMSPDGKKLAYVEGNGKLIVAEIDADGDMSNQKVLLDGWASPGGLSWSPDSKWLAYSLSDLNFNDEIYIHSADNSSEPVNVSMHPRGDYSPMWSADGSKIGFISERSNQDNDVWFAWLTKEDWQKTKEDWDEGTDKENDKKKKDDKDSTDTEEPIKIDLENIHERLVRVTNLPGNEGNLAISKDGETFYFTAGNPTAKGSDLYSIKWDGSDIKSITSGGTSPYAVSLDPEGKHLYFLKSGGSFSRIILSSDKVEAISFSAKMKIDYEKENEQIFEEAWRTLNDNFYDPNFHGKDWAELKKKYKPWVMQASTKTDFAYMFNLMLGEINASHMGLYSGDRAETQKESTGLLGIEIEPVNDGVKVLRVIPGSPADRTVSKLEKGDVIVSVNGYDVNDDVNFYSLLINDASDKIWMVVKSASGDEREVVIRPTGSLRAELYDEWVKERRRLTDEYSGGRLGYLHIQGMSWSSFERFERELAAVGYGKEGIVIDVRYNGGGWTTDYLMAVLNVDQHAYTVPRGATDDLEKNHLKYRENYPYAERLPFYPWTKPSIAMCNANSYSNAEIFSHAYKTMGIGTLVGEATFGAVISTGGKGLIDGSFVRMPFRAWYVKATDENMEWGPAVPDIEVLNSPDSKAKGKDEQLKRAVEELLKQIDG
ncbi:MAG: DPP IV N-terminal domain-containing protein [Melioribacteraceae bacterium]|nr:DPP IV N-terminal domain-containing protein [Melioribacteraceae bacterium]MCF8353643.1 DPP IV N-terminal domain-containing protein [Melioribacteraceae bacterium]MCF8393413.1 DPP IV N-terminal domain-containing protein [Melioribacteraceae bacterium]MCF8419270.1 DPP IV N-terminal domain-containing protein [Melioribacteraceae bacterium]